MTDKTQAPVTAPRALISVAVIVVIGALIAWAGGTHNWTLLGLPAFVVAVIVAFLVQWAVFIPSAVLRTERWFDLTGSLTFIGVSLLLVLSAPAAGLRAWVLTIMVVLWAVRLGSFLFLRIRKAGVDDRFDAIKTNPFSFLRVWTIQGLWVSATASAAWIAISSSNTREAGWEVWLGVLVWVFGMVIEVTADLQKSRFKANPNNQGKFINTGLWSRSRHPNYFGEITLWVGVLIVAAGALSGWQWVGVVSPLLVVVLLTRVSGIPLLERKADARWGSDPAYQRYKLQTPALIPRLDRPRSGDAQ